MHVFVSHSSKDKPAVEALARGLRERGIETWLDKWVIGPGDDIVAKINEGLETATAGLIVFSAHSRDSRWVEAEVSYLTYARVQEGKVLVPVVAGADAYIPPLLRPLARRGIEEIDAIADALLHRTAGPAPVVSSAAGRCEQVLVSLLRHETRGLRVRVQVGSEEYANAVHPVLPPDVVAARDSFQRGFRAGLRRGPVEATRASLEAEVAHLGRVLRDLCLPDGAGDAIGNLVDGCGVGTVVEICFEANDPELLGLPFESLRLPDDRLLAMLPPVVTLRRPVGIIAKEQSPPAGPIKVLVAVGAPDEGNRESTVLDHERELQNILDATEVAQRRENVEVRILEVGHPKVIAAAIERDAYHVVHLSCHGRPGQLELENEDGEVVLTTADEIIDPIRRIGRPLPLVFLNTCHGGVEAEQTASLSETLLRAGVPCVLAMQTSVSDHYATQLARAFYEHLARREPALASLALAEARKEIEQARLQLIQLGSPLSETQPEYATAALYVAGQERPVADFSLDKEPLRERPVYDVSGPVPQLRIDDLIGRRRELREVLRTLRDRERHYAGVVLTGLGGVGKSAVAGRAMRRLTEDGWRIAACAGRFDLREIAASVGAALIETDRAAPRQRAELLVSANLDDRLRIQLLSKALAEDPVLLVLDDFEQNLAVGGGAFLDPDVGMLFEQLARSARSGRLLVTCRYPIPQTEILLREVPIGPLSPAETRKLLQRLSGLRDCEPDEIRQVLRVIGGHPRILEFLDALLRGGEGRLPHVTKKLRDTLKLAGVETATPPETFDDQLQQVVLLGMRDVLLEELVQIARGNGDDDILFQAAVSTLPTSPAGLAHMLAGEPSDDTRIKEALVRLRDLSLVFRLPNDGSAWVHRWTAEGLSRIDDPAAHLERCNRAGRYRWWRVENESHDLANAVESVRNFLAGRDFDAAAFKALVSLEALRRFQQSLGIAALASEVLESLPEDHATYAAVADEEAQAHLALGLMERALERYEDLVQAYEKRVYDEPDRAEYQSNLAVSYERIGDLYSALGQGDNAHDAHLKSLEIRERLALAEPSHLHFQRELSVSYNKVGDLYRAVGQGDKARDAYLRSLAIAERLAQAEPDRAEYQRDLFVANERLGDLYRALGEGGKAREAYLRSLAIAERLAQAEPDRADYQHDLFVSYIKVGDLYSALGQGDKARDAYLRSLAIAERLAQAEPDRADYQRDLFVSYNKVGDLYSALGQGDKARDAYLRSLAIAERLAQAEPDRADYQRDLSVAYHRVGDLYSAHGQGDKARDAFLRSLAIAERLAQAEPDRADYQRDLSVSYNKVGDLYSALGEGDKARDAYLKSLQIRERLAQAEPDRADYQSDLSVAYNNVGDLYRALGQGDQARDAYLKSLAIAERLAQAEPDRADYQVDLAISLAKIGAYSDPFAREPLDRALAILQTLRSAGRLSPADEPKIQVIEELLRRGGVNEASPS